MLKTIINKISKCFDNKFVSIFVDLFCVFIVFYCQTDSLLFSINDRMRIIEFLLLFVVFIILFLRYICKHKLSNIFKTKCFLIVSTLSLIALISLLININNPFNVHRYFFTIINLFLSLMIILSTDYKRFIRLFILVLSFFSLFSIIIFSIYLLKTDFFSFMPIIENTAGYKFNYCFFSSVLVKDRIGLSSRNYGIFREPGVYAIFLLVGVVSCLFAGTKIFKQKTISIFIAILLSITLITTVSTTGILCLLFVLPIYFFYRFKSNNKVFWIGFIFIISVLIFSFYCILAKPPFIYKIDLFYSIFGKIDGTNISFVSRFFDQFATILCGLQNPLTGIGWGNQYTFISKLANAYNVISNGGTSTILLFYSVYGSIFGTALVYFLYKSAKSICRSPVCGFLVFLVLFVAVSANDMTNSLFIFLLPIFTYLNYYKLKGFVYCNYEEIVI